MKLTATLSPIRMASAIYRFLAIGLLAVVALTLPKPPRPATLERILSECSPKTSVNLATPT